MLNYLTTLSNVDIFFVFLMFMTPLSLDVGKKGEGEFRIRSFREAIQN